ncbi:hypothetical protein EYR36_008972 [Pleurotus pulmonarius]|nr:hypothetical protein EYR36_008972 [Pleurotus pulmonarius]
MAPILSLPTLFAADNADNGISESPLATITFGHPMLKYFSFEPGYINLNNGSFGSLPKPVAEFCVQHAARVEANPDRYHRLEFAELLTAARARVARLIGADTDECVFVPSTTAGINTILRNIEWNSGDVIIKFSTTYQGVERVARYIADTHPEVTLSTVELTFPISHQEILERFRTHVVGLRASCHSSSRIYAIIDSVVSHPGVALPWKEMSQICREEGVWSIIDAAHSIGQEIDIDLASAQPDFWVSNCHKWLFAKRGSTVLYVPKRNQHIIKSALVISWDYPSPKESAPAAYDTGFVLQHEWPGAIDFSPYLSVCAAIDFREEIGGEQAINEYCHNLALEGGRRLASVLGGRVLDESPSAELTLNMVNVQLPLPPTPSKELQGEIEGFLEHELLYKYNVSSVHFCHGGSWWVRCSAQIWNEVSDFEYLGSALNKACQEARLRTLQAYIQAVLPRCFMPYENAKWLPPSMGSSELYCTLTLAVPEESGMPTTNTARSQASES